MFRFHCESRFILPSSFLRTFFYSSICHFSSNSTTSTTCGPVAAQTTNTPLELLTKQQQPFLDWCHERGVVISPNIFIGTCNSRRGLFSRKYLKSGQCVAAIPFHSVFTIENFRTLPKSVERDLILGISKFDHRAESALSSIGVTQHSAIDQLRFDPSLASLLQLAMFALSQSLLPASRWYDWLKFVGRPQIYTSLNPATGALPPTYFDSVKRAPDTPPLDVALASPLPHACNLNADQLAMILAAKMSVSDQVIVPHPSQVALTEAARKLQHSLRWISTHHPLVASILDSLAHRHFAGNTFVVRTLLCDWAFALVGSRSFGATFPTDDAAFAAGLPFNGPFVPPLIDLLNHPDSPMSNGITADASVNHSNVIFEIVTRTEIASLLTPVPRSTRLLKPGSPTPNNSGIKKPVKVRALPEDAAIVKGWLADIGLSATRLGRSRESFLLLRTRHEILANTELTYRYLQPPANFDANYVFAYGFTPSDVPVGFLPQ